MAYSVRHDTISEEEVLRDLEQALREEQFVPFYQPQINIGDGAVRGAEALVRWLHPVHGYLSPVSFVPILEKHGLIYEMDRLIWRAVCRMMRAWKDEGIDFPPVSINVSRVDFAKGNVPEVLSGLVREYGIDPDELHVEITESAFGEDVEQIKLAMTELKQAGFFLEMDDFGSAFSSLAMLKELPFDLVKLDQGFLRGSGEDDKSDNILTAVVRLTQQLNMPVIAEGVMDPRQAEFLKSIGCFNMQGFLFSGVLSGEEYTEYLRQRCQVGQTAYHEEKSAYDALIGGHARDDMLFNRYIRGACIMEMTEDELTIVRANDRFYRSLGLRYRHLLDVHGAVRGMVSEGDYAKILAAAQQSEETDRDETCEIVYRAPGAERDIWLRVTVRILSRQLYGCLFYCDGVDVTDLHEYRETIAREHELLRQIVDEDDEAVLMYDGMKKKFLMANRAARAYLGKTEDEISSLTYRDVWGKDEPSVRNGEERVSCKGKEVSVLRRELDGVYLEKIRSTDRA